MPEMSPGSALRLIQQAHAGLKKARQLLRVTKGDPGATARVLAAGWESLAQAHRLLATITVEAATEPVMTRGRGKCKSKIRKESEMTFFLKE